MTRRPVLHDTGERMVPEYHQGNLIYAEHLTRYLCAQSIVKGKVVLDIASGSGYGTEILAKSAKHVYGVDVSDEAINYARIAYAKPNLEFITGDGIKIPLGDKSVDVVVSFETIEHIEDYRAFIKEVVRVMRPDGLAIISTPNDLEFAEGNHFHLHEFQYKELLSELKKSFSQTKAYFQATWKSVVIGPEHELMQEGPVKARTINLSPIDPKQFLYFYILCSNRAITEEIDSLHALGGHYSDRSVLAEAETQAIEKQQLNEQLVSLDETAKELRDELELTKHKLSQIISSRSYRLAQKLSKAKHRLSRTHRP